MNDRGRILVVDDDAAMRELLAEALTPLGFVVQTHPSAEAALAAAAVADGAICPSRLGRDARKY